MRFCFIVFCFIPAFCLAQLDSTCVKPFFDKTEFPNVVKIYYEQNKHLNGKLKSEGWIIEELGGRNSSILKVEGLTEETTMYHKIGVWKYY
ncbi:MAG: hypothetical protein KDD41_07540, partial [Flavobacteriales bacterium]|nr:hypothetical protein [Flavobacteriales bacterium]